ncbi:MAG: hypothetical protein ACXVCH_14000 [Bdellovibrionota bacterium]
MDLLLAMVALFAPSLGQGAAVEEFNLRQAAKAIQIRFEQPEMNLLEDQKKLEISESWIRLDPEQGARNFPTLTLTIPAELPEGMDVLGPDLAPLKPQSVRKDKSIYLLQIPIRSLEENEAVVKLVPANGKPISLKITTQLKIAGDQVLLGPDCATNRVSLQRTAQDPGGPTLFIVNCDSGGGVSSAAAIHAIRDVKWSDTPEGTLTLKDDSGIYRKVEVPKGQEAQDLPILPFTTELEGRKSAYQLIQNRGLNQRWWGHFQGFAIGGYQQSTGGVSVSGGVTWNPQWIFNRWVGIRGNFGGMLFRSFTTGLYFPALEYSAFADFLRFRPFQLGIGGGGQSWVYVGGSSTTAPEISANFAYVHPRKLLWIFERAFVEYTVFFFPGDYVHEVKAGLGVSF